MRTIFQIFASDLRAVSRQFFAMVILIAICILPALYAWFNIYSNHDPYGGTGNIRIAVASRDPGIELDGAHVNMADEVLETLRESDSIGWTFPDTPEEAIAGVEAGDYYAAIVFEVCFTDHMYHVEQALLSEEPGLTFYQNGKKNAIASKITETAAGTLQETINTKYLQTLFRTVFQTAGGVSSAVSREEAVKAAVSDLTKLQKQLKEYLAAIDAFTGSTDDVTALLSGAGMALRGANTTGSAAAGDAKAAVNTARRQVNALSDAIDARLAAAEAELDALADAITELSESEPVERMTAAQTAMLDRAIARAARLQAHWQVLRGILPEESALPGAKLTAAHLDAMIARTEALQSALEGLRKSGDVRDLAALSAEWSDTVAALRKLLNGTLRPDFDTLTDDLVRVLDQVEPLLGTVQGAVGDLAPVVDSAGTTVKSMDSALRGLRDVLSGAEEKLSALIDQVETAAPNEQLQTLIDALGGNADQYGTFFSALVDVQVQEIYSVNSYGTAMAPFYSVLALWVGGVILVAILKVHTDPEKFPNATDTQRFFGRFLLFFLVGQVQAAVIVLGDLYLLDCEAVHPWLLWASAAVTSLVFVLFIYSLTLSFGDVGKAIVVVVMVLQIAGSSGSYPIEILPDIFSKIYLFFPFPYAINAMREAICGVYQYDLLRYLGELGLFGVLGLVIGLVVRRPFIGMNEFVEEKLEETEVI